MPRWLLRIVAGLAALLALLFFAARMHDGPLGPLPGGPLAAGPLVTEPLADWSEEGFVEGLKTMWAFDKPAVILRVGGVALVVFVIVMGLIGLAID